MFTATVFVITKTRKQLRCPSVGELINKLVYLDDRILFSIKKKKYQAIKRQRKLICMLPSESLIINQ